MTTINKLRNDSVQIWIAQVPEEVVTNDILSTAELIQAERFVFQCDRSRFLATRVMTRLVLSKYVDKHPSALKFISDEYGKPFLKGDGESVFFNLSHTEKVIVCAVAPFRWIGIDIEQRVPDEYFDLAKQFFSDEETRWIIEVPKEAGKQRFLHLWTHKEAFVKAIGKGFSIPLQCFSVVPDADGKSIVEDPMQAFSNVQCWELSAFEYASVFGAICYPFNGKERDIQLNTFDEWEC